LTSFDRFWKPNNMVTILMWIFYISEQADVSKKYDRLNSIRTFHTNNDSLTPVRIFFNIQQMT